MVPYVLESYAFFDPLEETTVDAILRVPAWYFSRSAASWFVRWSPHEGEGLDTIGQHTRVGSPRHCELSAIWDLLEVRMVKLI
jgi:hypothetical protein